MTKNNWNEKNDGQVEIFMDFGRSEVFLCLSMLNKGENFLSHFNDIYFCEIFEILFGKKKIELSLV